MAQKLVKSSHVPLGVDNRAITRSSFDPENNCCSLGSRIQEHLKRFKRFQNFFCNSKVYIRGSLHSSKISVYFCCSFRERNEERLKKFDSVSLFSSHTRSVKSTTYFNQSFFELFSSVCHRFQKQYKLCQRRCDSFCHVRNDTR